MRVLVWVAVILAVFEIVRYVLTRQD